MWISFEQFESFWTAAGILDHAAANLHSKRLSGSRGDFALGAPQISPPFTTIPQTKGNCHE